MRVLTMASVSQQNLDNAIRGLLSRNPELCNEAIAEDDDVNAYERTVDREGFEILMRFNPVATDLREVLSGMKVANNLERISDQAESIARRSRKILKATEVPEIKGIEPIYEMALGIFQDSIKAFSEGIEIERYLWNARKILKALGTQIHSILYKGGIESPEPDGAFYLFINFKNFSEKLKAKNIFTGFDLTTRLLEDTGVALLPGSAFGRSEEEYTARLSYVDFDGARAMAAAETIRPEDPLPDGFTERYCAHQMEGIKTIVDWVKSL